MINSIVVKNSSLFWLIFCLTIFPSFSHAAAWVQEKGKSLLCLQLNHYQTDDEFDSEGNKKSRDGDFRKTEINTYLEYGLTDKDTIVANLFYDWLRDDKPEPSESNQGFADIELGWRRQLLKTDPHVATFQVLSIIPTGYDIQDSPRLGYGRFGLEGSFSYGRNFKWFEKYGFLDTSLGFRAYFGYPSEQIRSSASIGYDLLPPLQIIGSGELHYGLDNGSEKKIGSNVIAQPNYRLFKLTLMLRYRLSPKYSIVGAAYRHVWGEDTGAGGGVYGGIWINFGEWYKKQKL